MADIRKLVRAAHGAPSEREDGRVYEIARLANRGEVDRAAEAAVALLSEGVADPALFAYALAGEFLARGVAILPELAEQLSLYLRGVLAEPLSEGAAARVDAALAWLFRTLVMHVDYHLAQRDATLRAWLTEVSSGALAPLPASLAKLRDDVVRVRRRSKVPPLLSTLERRVTVDLEQAPEARRTVVPVPATEPRLEPEPEAPPAVAAEPDAPPESDAFDAPSGFGAEVPASPALVLLLRKLSGFTLLVERGELARAAVVARDIETEIESFDPVRYLPTLFGGYSELLNRVGDQLAPFFEARESLSQRALSRSYRADLEAFLSASASAASSGRR